MRQSWLLRWTQILVMHPQFKIGLHLHRQSNLRKPDFVKLLVGPVRVNDSGAYHHFVAFGCEYVWLTHLPSFSAASLAASQGLPNMLGASSRIACPASSSWSSLSFNLLRITATSAISSAPDSIHISRANPSKKLSQSLIRCSTMFVLHSTMLQ